MEGERNKVRSAKKPKQSEKHVLIFRKWIFLKMYLFLYMAEQEQHGKKDKERERILSSVDSHIQMATASPRLGQNKEAGDPSESLQRVSGLHVLELFSTAFPCTLLGSCIKSVVTGF